MKLFSLIHSFLVIKCSLFQNVMLFTFKINAWKADLILLYEDLYLFKRIIIEHNYILILKYINSFDFDKHNSLSSILIFFFGKKSREFYVI